MKGRLNSQHSFNLIVITIGCLLMLTRCVSDSTNTDLDVRVEIERLKDQRKGVDYNEDREAWIEHSFNLRKLIQSVKGDHPYVLNFYHHLGYNYRKFGLYRESLETYKEFFNYYEAHEKELDPERIKEFRRKRSFDYRGTAFAYERLGHLDSAYFEHQKNLNLVGPQDSIWEPAALNDYGMFLEGSKKDTLAALTHFQKAYETTVRKFPDHELIGSIRSNIAGIFVKQSKLDLAFDLYMANYNYYKNHPDQNKILAFKSAQEIIKINRTLRKLKNVDDFHNDVASLYPSHIVNKEIKTRLKLEYLKFEKEYLLSQEDFKKSLQLLEWIKAMSDSIILSENKLHESSKSKMSELAISSIKSNFELQQRQKESALLNQRLIIWIITIVFIFFLSVMSFLVYRRKQQIKHAKNSQRIAEQLQLLTETRNNHLKLEVESKKRDLSDFAIKLTHNQEWASILAQRLEKLKPTRGRERKKLLEELEQEVLKKTRVDSNTKEFFERLDKLSDSFYSRLNSQFPDLSKTEKRLCSLIRLKMENRNIATMQNISLGSLNTSRYRLRKKLNLRKEDDLDDFIQTL